MFARESTCINKLERIQVDDKTGKGSNREIWYKMSGKSCRKLRFFKK